MQDNFRELASRFAHVHILTPKDLHAQCEGLTQRPDLSGYVLTGWVSDEEAKMVEDRRLPHATRFSLYPTPSGIAVAVATLQAGSLQLRWFIPLVDERPHAWLQWSIEHARIAHLLNIGEGKQVTWCQMPLVFEQADTLKARLEAPRAVNFVSAFSECALLNARFAHIDAVPTCIPHVSVRTVRVFAVTDGLAEALNASPQGSTRH